MQIASLVPLLINLITLAIATAFLVIVSFYTTKQKQLLRRIFALFLAMVALWSLGFMLREVFVLWGIASGSLATTQQVAFERMSLGADIATRIGFSASSVALYVFLTVLVGIQPRRFWLLTALYFVMVVGYSIGLTLADFGAPSNITLLRGFDVFTALAFNLGILYIAWRYRKKLHDPWLFSGVLVFVIGQGLRFMNPQLSVVALSSSVGAFGALAVSIAIIRQEVVDPLLERGNHLEAMHNVSVSITSRIASDAVLSEIAERATTWLEADATAIFIRRGNYLELVTHYELHDAWLGIRLAVGEGMVGQAAAKQDYVYMENYSRDWKGLPDLPIATDTFGSSIAMPLIYNDDVIAVLLVISGLHNRLLDYENVHSLKMFAAQAAVAISHGNLFAAQKSLTQQVETALSQLKTVLEGTESPVIAVNRGLELIFANPAAFTLLEGYGSEASGPITNSLPENVLPSSYRDVLKDIKAQEVHIYEITLDSKVYFCHLATLGNERVEGWVAVLNDVTELKELDRAKSEMVRMTSHDLKNPLQAAMANLDLLRDDLSDLADSIDSSEMSLSLDNIEKQLHKMMRIISGILDLERAKMGSRPIERCDPQQIIAQVIAELEDIAQDSGVVLETVLEEKLPLFLGDQAQFSRAIVNLVENAIKFNRADGRVTVRVWSENDKLRMSVSDTGIGIPEDRLDHIFDRFYRGHQAGAEHISGSGLGLSLVKAVVESHHGSIWVESEPNVGTIFHIALPVVTNNPVSSLST